MEGIEYMKKTMMAFMLALALVTMSACGAQDKTSEATAAPVVTAEPTAETTEAPQYASFPVCFMSDIL